MTIDQRGVVDALGVETATGVAVLTIIDHLPWSRENLVKLQDKINSYLAFLETGEIYASYPDAKGRPLRISVLAKFRPSPEAAAFLETASRTIEAAGLQFSYGPASNGYEGDG